MKGEPVDMVSTILNVLFKLVSVQFPKYVIGETDTETWIIRTRNPFLMAKVTLDGFNLSFDIFPPSSFQNIPNSKQDKIATMLVEIYLNEVANEDLDDLKITYDLFFSGDNPPTPLQVFSRKSRWKGSLICQNGKYSLKDDAGNIASLEN